MNVRGLQFSNTVSVFAALFQEIADLSYEIQEMPNVKLMQAADLGDLFGHFEKAVLWW